MPIRGMLGICPAGGAAAGGATGGGGARFGGTDIILVYSLGPCGAAAGGFTGVARNAWVAPPPGPYDAGGAGAWGAAGIGSGGVGVRAREWARESVQAGRTEFRGRTCECIHRTPAGAEAERAGIPLPGTVLPETGTPRETAVPPAFPQTTA